MASYPEIYNLGHKAVSDLLSGEVIVEEKVDGSQFSFWRKDGTVRCRSKGQELHVEAPEKLFTEGVGVALELSPLLRDGWTYRAEYLKKARHNTLAYDRIPHNHLILFDIDRGEENYLSPLDKMKEGARIGLEVVPVLFTGLIENEEHLRALLETESVLGGQKIEGVVIKPLNYDLFGRDKKVLMGKFVSERFKEIHGVTWKKDNPNLSELVDQLGESYATEARWRKALQHLRDEGSIEDSPRDIGPLLKEINQDIEKEAKDEIIEELWRWAWKVISRRATRGFPEWYKSELVHRQFGG